MSLKVVQGSTVVLAQLDKSLVFDNYVNQLCITEDEWTVYDNCIMSGMSGDLWTKTISTEVTKCSSTELCLSSSSPFSADTSNWAGALACVDSAGKYHAVGVYHSLATTLPGRVTSLGAEVGQSIAKVISAGLAAQPAMPEDTCEGLRCSFGNCVEEENICDRN